ncbi:cell division topological determinant MinJ [Oxobacter pfennigii]|uniref:Cell division topological determinant MinJ n=1 Tax=Oxobacter pfennigii TaxID=36849 RepID=A0A0P8WYF2_9CLOT|nr:PDZ domain-containing protein [Oxobacter pfennigii]KPU43414.1 cell division topological determinant MinJ [Oxobacter pfennigii]
MDILAMLKICFSAVASAVLMPDANLWFILLLMVIYFQYKKNIRLQEIVYGKPKYDLTNLMVTSVLSGIAAGLIISMPMTIIGISFSRDMGLQYLILISLVLMFIEPRFLCFSYSGGILSLVSLIFGIKGIDPTGIMILVASLHLMEALLIYVDGFRGAVPVFYERKNGEITGGFSMQRYWPVPIALIVFMGYEQVTGDVVATPSWWPIIRPFMDPERMQEALFVALPLTAILGHGSFTASYMPKDKCKDTSFKLAVFALMLLILSILSSFIYVFKYIAALFAPLAHEFLIQLDRKQELERAPLFSSSPEGIKVLDTIPDGPGEKMGIKPGDTVMSINNKSVKTEEDMDEFFKDYVSFIWVDVKDIKGDIKTLEFKNYNEGIDSLELICIPGSNSNNRIMVKESRSILKRLFNKES